MKTFSEIIKNTSALLSENNSVNSVADQISLILERTEAILQRKLNNSEFEMFTDILISEEMAQQARKDDDKGSEPVFKKGKYTIEIVTSEGKVTRTASSQKGLLDVIHGQKNYRVLDQNNRDITSKLKSFIKERQKQALLRKKMVKKLKEETERAGFKFERFFNLREESQTSSRESFYKTKLAEIEARTDLSPEQKKEAADIIKDQLERAKTGPKKVEKGEEVTTAVSVKGGAFEKDSPAPKRADYESDEDFAKDSKAWSNVQKGIAKTEQETSTMSELPTAVGERLQDPDMQVALTVGSFIPGVNAVAIPLSAAAGAYGLKKQIDQGQFSGEAETDWLDTAGNVLSILPAVGALGKGAKALKAGRSANVLSKEIEVAKAAGKSADEIAALTAARGEKLAQAGRVGAAVTAPIGKVASVAREAGEAVKASKLAKAAGLADDALKAGSAGAKSGGLLKTTAKLAGTATVAGAAAYGLKNLLSPQQTGTSQQASTDFGDVGGDTDETTGLTRLMGAGGSKSKSRSQRLTGQSGVNISYT
jgi:hypothetical protein